MPTQRRYSIEKMSQEKKGKSTQLNFFGQLMLEELDLSQEESIRILEEQALADAAERLRLREIIRLQRRAYRKAKEYLEWLAQSSNEEQEVAASLLLELKEIEAQAKPTPSALELQRKHLD